MCRVSQVDAVIPVQGGSGRWLAFPGWKPASLAASMPRVRITGGLPESGRAKAVAISGGVQAMPSYVRKNRSPTSAQLPVGS